MSLTIIADENIPAVEDYLGALGKVVRVPGRALTRAQLADVDILLVRSVTRVDESLLAGTAVRFVGTATSGIDHIDRDYLARSGIAFAHAPGANANSVVEYVLAAVAAVADSLERLLAGGRVGIVGYGNIGRALAARLDALDIHYHVFDPWLDLRTVPNAAELDDILDCDVVSLHPELCTNQPWPSHHLLGRAELARLGAGSLLINASRGSVVDNAALRECLQRAQTFAAVLDVWEDEPDVDPALLDRVVFGTAHIAGYSLDGKLLATRMLADAVLAELGEAASAGRDSAQFAASLRVPPGLAGAGLVRSLIDSRYDIRVDDGLLRQSVAAAPLAEQRRAAFDQLRRSYRDRRELSGSVVEDLAPHQVPLARALGCIPCSGGSG